MQIVIDITEDTYELITVEPRTIKNLGDVLSKAIQNGTILPERHGRLIDADKVLEQERPKGISDDVWKESHIFKTLNRAQTVVKADKEPKDLNEADIEFNQYIDMIDIKDSMQLDSEQTIADMKLWDMKATIEVRGLVKVWWNPNVNEHTDDGTGALNGDCFRYPSDFPKELKELIKNDKEWFNDCRVYVADNNWFECFVYDYDDRFITSYTVDVEGVSSEGIRNLLLEAIKSQY